MHKAIISPPAPPHGVPTAPGNADTSAQRALWRLLDALALCRQSLGLAPNSLSVLRALISFLPKTTALDGALVVWPSNKSLCERADGMDERTLRRHIERLVKAGLIERRTSSNGKRFAVRRQSTLITAFGFDLAPLRDNSDALSSLARQIRDDAEHTAALRVEILNALHALAYAGTPLDQAEDAQIRKVLRRRSDAEMLQSILATLRGATMERQPDAMALTASARQNDRHQQKTEEDSFISVCPQISNSDASREGEDAEKQRQDEDISLQDCLDATSESRAFSPEPIVAWRDFLRLADRLAPMIGIGAELANHASRAMGPLQAAISILCVIQRGDHISRPAAYLRRLAHLAEKGQYSLKSLVRAAARSRFTAANRTPA